MNRVELKALDAISSLHESQALSYLKATGLRLAIILNFDGRTLQQKRIVL